MASLPHLDDAERRARLVTRHHLCNGHRVDDPVAIAASMVAVHSTDPATVYLSMVARMAHPSLAAVSDALYVDRSLVRIHAMRRTLWVMTPQIARLAHAGCTASLARKEWEQLHRWVARSGIDEPAVWLEALTEDVLAALHRLGPSTTRALGKAVPELTHKIKVGSGAYVVDAPAHTRVLLNLGFDARIVRTEPTGTWINSEYTWRAMDDWIPGGLAGFASVHVNAALKAVGPAEVALDRGQTGYVMPDDVEVKSAAPSPTDVAFLPALDSTTMGWKQRSWYLGEHTTRGGPLFDRSGNAGPTVWSGGRVVGGWAQRADGSVAYELLEPVDRAATKAIERQAAVLTALLSGSRITPRFPTPLQRLLAGSPSATA